MKIGIIIISSKCSFLIQRSPDIIDSNYVIPLPIQPPYSKAQCNSVTLTAFGSPLTSIICTSHYLLGVLISLVPGLESVVHHQDYSFANTLHFHILFLHILNWQKHRYKVHPSIPLLHALLQVADWSYFKYTTKTLTWAFSIA